MFSSSRLDRPLTAVGSALVLLALAAPPAGAQQPDRPTLDALEQAYPLEVVDRVDDLLERTEAEGLPARPLAEKALEGAAKRVPGDRLLEALEHRRTGLDRAAEALGPGADAASLKAGAAALAQGLRPDHLQRIGEVAPEADRPAALVVLGELNRLDVPVDRALEAVISVLERDGAAGLWALEERARAAERNGASPRAALAAAARGPLPGAGSSGLAPALPGELPARPVPPGTGPPSEGPPGEDDPPGDDTPNGPPPGSRG